MPKGFRGNVTVYVDDEEVSTTPVSGGKNIIPISGLEEGNNYVEVVLTDENGYSYEFSKSVHVEKPEPKMDIIVPMDSTVPQFTISLSDDATGSLIVGIAGQIYSKDLKNGGATFTIPGLADGTYETVILYSGDDKYSGFVKYVMMPIKTRDKKDLNLAIKVPSVYRANNVVVTITTDSSFTGTVNVKIKSKTYAVNVINGKGTKSISGLGVGTYTATATFSGNDVFKSVTKSVNFKVKANVIKLTLKKIKVRKSAKKLTLKATLKINGKVAKGKTLKFKFNKKKYKAKTNKKGVAKVIIKKNVLRKLKVGKKVRYQVTYGKKQLKEQLRLKNN